jgi:hypothetical protein
MQKKLKSNYQDKLKLIAILAMILDHITLYFMPEIEILRVIGRVSMPIFCFFAGYNFKDNKERRDLLKYGLYLTVASFLLSNSWVVFNMLCTIYIGNFYLRRLYSPVPNLISNMFQILPLIILTPPTMMLFEYGTIAIAFMLIGYLYKHHQYYRKAYIIIFAFLICIVGQIQFWFEIYNFLLLVSLAILFYYLMIDANFEMKVQDDIRYITRNSLMIYFITSLSFICLGAFI